MLQVKTPEEVMTILRETFSLMERTEEVPLDEAEGRILAREISAPEYVPDFDRSTVDGYAVRAADTFGCSDALPAVLTVCGSVRMGSAPGFVIMSGTCAVIPTGGALPEGADSVVMVEYTEDYGDGTVGILKGAAPGANIILKGDDVYPGKPVLPAGTALTGREIGALAAMGICRVPVRGRIRAGIISTGDEVVDAGSKPGPGQIRDVNSQMLAAEIRSFGGIPVSYGIIPDEEDLLLSAVSRALGETDLVLISGGTSAGTKDAAARVIGTVGEVMLHGIAMKPGKPTILGRAGGKPVFGLPGHPAAAWFVTELFVRAAVDILQGTRRARVPLTARLEENIGANHGRAEYIGVRLREEGGEFLAAPIHSKSGLITGLTAADGWFCIPRDCEGLAAGEQIRVYGIRR